jgi:hypothetical protein
MADQHKNRPQVKFSYSLPKDAWSWVLIAKDQDVWGLDWRDQVAHMPAELLLKLEKASFPRAQKIVEQYIKANRIKKYKNNVRALEMQALEKAWRLIEKKYFQILAQVTGEPIFRDKFTCYFTTGFMCPYNERENWFMVSMWHGLPFSLTTICHEIMHLQFLAYYRDYLQKRGLQENQIEVLKESLTFLLNEPEFSEIILGEDRGYPDHQKIRIKLKKIWSKNKNFSKLVDEAINLVK